MTIRKLFQTDKERAVSPVIGVVLMVAITVILAAVIGAFVMGLGDGLGEGTAPSAQLSISESTLENNIQVSHNGGDDVDFSEFSLIVNGSVVDDATLTGELSSGESMDLAIGQAGDGLDIQLRHDSSNSVLTSGTVDVSGTAS